MKFIHGFIIAAFLVAFSTQSTPVRRCQDGPMPTEVRVEGCEKVPCLLHRGTNATAEWDFSVQEGTKQLKPRVMATALGVTVSYPFPQKNACETLKDVSCPLKAGQQVTYALTMPILKIYPKVPLEIEFAFLDDNGLPAVCFKLQAKVVD